MPGLVKKQFFIDTSAHVSINLLNLLEKTIFDYIFLDNTNIIIKLFHFS